MSFKSSKTNARKEQLIRDTKKCLFAIFVLLLVMVVLVGAGSMASSVGLEDVEESEPVVQTISETSQPDSGTGYKDTKNEKLLITSRVYTSPNPEPSTYEDTSIKDEQVPTVEEPELIPVEHTDTERSMMLYCVELETHDASLEHKKIVSCVIVNRLYSEDFNYDSLEEVLTAKNQFSGMSNYYNQYYEPDADTIAAVDGVLSGEISPDEVSQGATFFYNPDRVGRRLSSFENRTFLFELEGHRFFK